ncbi:MAG TPA: septum formation initiator family protein [Pseudomonadales bacterium]|nr:septum formation initiator family protein [Pseudomonadales bacterium]
MTQRQAKAPFGTGLFLVLAAMLATMQYRLWFGETGSFAELKRLQNSIEANQQTNDSLAERNRVLSAQVRDLKKDRESLKKDTTNSDGMSALEERARTELGMIRRDEVFYLIVDDKRRTTK